MVGGTTPSRTARAQTAVSSAPARAEQVPGHRLRGGDGEAVGVRPEDGADGGGLRAVVERRGRAVGVDVADLLRRDARRRRARRASSPPTPSPSGCGCGDVVGVVGRAVADQLGHDRRAARAGVVLALQHDHRGALADDEPVAGRVEGPRRRRRVVGVAGRAERAHVAEAAEDELGDAGLDAAREDAVRVAAADISAASPMAWAPVAQAETTAKFGPRMPRSVAT